MKTELLAPAGSFDALKAAVYAGADAVYFGGTLFNARVYANNFDDENIKTAIEFCRLYGVKVYITLNTLIFDREFKEVLDFVSMLEEDCPPDAYIVQDLGLASSLRETFEGIQLHASTQLLVHNSFGIDLLKEKGFSRVVVARECSKSDIAAIKKSGIETEVFVHGALCVSASGGCLFSAAIGDRSGNRGSCAQPCRQSYNGTFPLSLKDLCLAEHVKEMLEMGIDCMKIEGRMKSPEYVYTITKVYRTLIDERRLPTDAELAELKSVFTRSGFTDGYFTAEVGPHMSGIRTEEDKAVTRNTSVEIRERKLNVQFNCVVKNKMPSSLEAYFGGISFKAYGAVPEKALKHPLAKEDLTSRLKKLGNTPFLAEVELTLEDGLILPVSAVNSLRREVCEGLKSEIIKNNSPKGHLSKNNEVANNAKKDFCRNLGNKKTEIVLRFEGDIPSAKFINKLLAKVERIDVPLWRINELQGGTDFSKISAIMPRTVFNSERDTVCDLLKRARTLGISQLTVPNVSFIPLCDGFTLHGDYTLNITNSRTLKEVSGLGFDSALLSFELNPRFVGEADLKKEYIVYGRMPLMHTECCMIQNAGKCQGKNKGIRCSCFLTDKTGASFLAMREYGHRNIIYNAFPTYLLDKRKELAQQGINGFILLFTNECEKTVENVLDRFERGLPPEGKFTRAALKK